MKLAFCKLILRERHATFVLYSNYVPKIIIKSDKIIPVSGPVTSGCVQVMFIDILSS